MNLMTAEAGTALEYIQIVCMLVFRPGYIELFVKQGQTGVGFSLAYCVYVCFSLLFYHLDHIQYKPDLVRFDQLTNKCSDRSTATNCLRPTLMQQRKKSVFYMFLETSGSKNKKNQVPKPHFPSIGSEDPPLPPPQVSKCENSGKF